LKKNTDRKVDDMEGHHDGIIGIVGGVGPYAGLDLKKKIFDNTVAFSDQEHLEVYLLSCSKHITDRTGFLKDPSANENPGIAIFEVIRKLQSIGATVIAIPCNTSHSSLIWNKITSLMEESGIKIDLLNMIEETKNHIKIQMKGINKIGLLATLGVYKSAAYEQTFDHYDDPKIVTPDENFKKMVHESIYDKSFGIKAFSNPVTKKAKDHLKETIERLKEKGSQAIIMGCTEIPLALNENDCTLPLIDPTEILARSLIGRIDMNKLKDKNLSNGPIVPQK
jgi:aspartate racemase